MNHFEIIETKQCTIEIDVFAASKLWVEPNAKLNKRSKGAIDSNSPLSGSVNTGKHLQQRTFA